jgi:hypothetical protein
MEGQARRSGCEDRWPCHRRRYIRNSIGLLVGQDILDGEKEELSDLLGEKIDETFDYIRNSSSSVISVIRYGDGDPSTRDVVVNLVEATGSGSVYGSVLRLNFTIRGVTLKALPLYGHDMISTQDNDLTIDTHVAVRDMGSQSQVRLVLDFLSSAQVTFSQDFFFRDVVQDIIASEFTRADLPPVSFDMGSSDSVLRDFLPDYISINGKDVGVDAMTGGFYSNLEKYMFVDLYGITDNAEASSLAMGMGLAVQDYEDMAWETVQPPAPQGQTAADEIFDSMFESTVDDVFAAVREKYEGVVTTLSYGDGVSGTPDFAINSLVLQETGDVNVRTRTSTLR